MGFSGLIIIKFIIIYLYCSLGIHLQNMFSFLSSSLFNEFFSSIHVLIFFIFLSSSYVILALFNCFKIKISKLISTHLNQSNQKDNKKKYQQIFKNIKMQVDQENDAKDQFSKQQNNIENENSIQLQDTQIVAQELQVRLPVIQRQCHDKKKNPIFITVCFMIILIGIFSFINSTKSSLIQILVGLTSISLQKHDSILNNGGFDLFKILSFEKDVYKINKPIQNLCKKSYGIFSTYYNKTDTQMEYINEEYENRAKYCNVSILGYKNLKNLKRKWNDKYPQKIINLTNFKDSKAKQMLLILLQLYFKAGIYINIEIPYSQIEDRCWKYALIGYEPLYADFHQEINGIYVPDLWKFIKVRFPYTLEIKSMIEGLIEGKDLMEECKRKQCLIIKCYNS